MRKLALAIGPLLVLMAASFVSPVGALAASPSHSPRVAGPQTGARSNLHSPSHLSSARAPSISVAALACDGGFDAVASPNLSDNNYLVATSAVGPNDVWAVGNTFSTTVGVYDRALVEHWDGTSWTIIPASNPTSFNVDLTGVVAVSTNDVWVVGVYATDGTGNTMVAYAQHWNGTTWNAGYIFTPSSFSFLLAITATSSTDVWAVGTYFDFNIGVVLTLVEHWNGTGWSQIASPSPSTFDNELFGVSAWSSTDIWAVGEQTSASGQPFQSLAEHWNGTAWSLIATPNTTGDNQVLWVAALEPGHAVGVGYGNFVLNSAPLQSESWDLLAVGTSTNNASLGTGLGTGNNVLIGVARAGASVWAVGYSRPLPSSPRQTLAIPATWDAAGHTLTWDPVGTSANPSATNSVLDAVTAVSPYSFWAADYQSGASLDQTLTESYCALHFGLTAPASNPIASAFTVTVTAQNGDGTTATGYRGTVHFTSSDPSATLPANYTFISGDNGSHTFTGVVLRTLGSRTITVTDIAMPFTMPASAAINVFCVGACPAPAGTPGSRNTGQVPPGTPGARTGVNQSGSGVPGPRLPRVTQPAQSGDNASAAGPATTTGSDSNVTAAAPSAASTSPGSAPPAAGAAPAATSTKTVQAPAHRGLSLTAQSEPVSRTPEPTPWNLLLLVPLVVSTLALAALRRRRIKEKSNAGI